MSAMPLPPPPLPPPAPARRPPRRARVNPATIWIIVKMAAAVTGAATCLFVGESSTKCKYDAATDTSFIINKRRTQRESPRAAHHMCREMYATEPETSRIPATTWLVPDAEPSTRTFRTDGDKNCCTPIP